MQTIGLIHRRFHSSVKSKFTLVARLVLAVSVLLFSVLLLETAAFAQTPAVGDKAPNFTLKTITGTPVQLEKEQHGSSLVLVLLRGYPGYQCPYCQKQVHDFVEHAAGFAAKKARVLLVYPGSPADLDQRAREFLATEADLPSNIVLVIDPNYKMTNLYGLRWDAPRETAYPSTFVLNKQGIILFEKISRTHGDRLPAQDALDHLPAK
jgi:peroxiredoxin